MTPPSVMMTGCCGTRHAGLRHPRKRSNQASQHFSKWAFWPRHRYAHTCMTVAGPECEQRKANGETGLGGERAGAVHVGALAG
eukprot:3893909-Pleurochrysis_carterae.AAC.1